MTNEVFQIIEAVKSLGGDAREAFIWWIIADKIAQPFMWFAGCGFLIWVTRKGWVSAVKAGEKFIKEF